MYGLIWFEVTFEHQVSIANFVYNCKLHISPITWKCNIYDDNIFVYHKLQFNNLKKKWRLCYCIMYVYARKKCSSSHKCKICENETYNPPSQIVLLAIRRQSLETPHQRRKYLQVPDHKMIWWDWVYLSVGFWDLHSLKL